MQFALAGLRRHPVLLCGALDARALARLGQFFEIEIEDGTLDRATLRTRLDGKAVSTASAVA